MPDHRVPASAGQFHGELRLADDGMTFVPVTTRDGDQMVLAVGSWRLDWRDVAGIERVDGRGNLRVHYDDASRFLAVRIHGSMQDLFAAADAFAAAANEGRRRVA